MMKRIVFALALLATTSLFAQGTITSTCYPSGKPLQKIPELASGADGVLRGFLYTVSEQVSLQDPQLQKCQPQIVRAYRLEPGPSNPPTSMISDPLPGPTLRARVGDLIALTFLNQIDPLRFPNADGPCDAFGNDQSQPTSYPGNTPYSDQSPDCFNGSVYTNMHYHGTHVSPQTTGDNVFLMIAPSPRAEDQARTPAVTRQSIAGPLGEFFARCEAELPPGSAPKEWPRVWNDFPKSWRDMQQSLLQQNYPKLWLANEKAILQGNFPQYYTGAFPYCFRIPKYVSADWPPAPKPDTLTPHTHGAGSAEVDEAAQPKRPLIMGQAPGTHWYHAHKHGSTTINVMNGMTGAFIIEGEYDDYINSKYTAGFTRKAPVIVLNQLGAVPRLLQGGGGSNPKFSVNGRIAPTITMAPGEVQMWRIVNSSSRNGASFLAPTNLQWKVLARDGVQFTQHNYDKSTNTAFLLTAGNRIDLLVKAPSTIPAAPIAVKAFATVNPTGTPGTPQDIFTVTVSGTPVTMNFLTEVAPFPPYLKTIEDKEVTGTKKLVFATTDPPDPPIADAVPAAPRSHTIDGKKFDGEQGVVVGLNQVEEWKVINESFGPQIAHPFHIHVNPFQIVEIFAPSDKIYVFDPKQKTEDNCYIDPKDESTWKPCAKANPGFVKPEDRVWWDVFSIPAGQTPKDKDGKTFTDKDGKTINIPGYFKMRSRFVDYAGYFVLHCHILAHEDRGMMTVVQVAPLQTPFSHH